MSYPPDGPPPRDQDISLLAEILNNKVPAYMHLKKNERPQLIERNHARLKSSAEARFAIEIFFGKRWIAGGWRFTKFDGIPCFPEYADWEVVDKDEHLGPLGTTILAGALLSGQTSRHEQDPTVKVVLFRDRSLSQGYAIRVPPQVNTVQEAIAAHYGFSSKKFRGFTKEV